MSKNDNKKIVVSGLGPVGLTIAVSLAMRTTGRVLGLDIEENKVHSINQGNSHFLTNDHKFLKSLKQVIETEKLVGTTDPAVLKTADVIVIAFGPVSVDTHEFIKIIHEVGSIAKKDALFLIVSTLPVGTLNTLAITQDFAFAYERITPGPDMLESFQLLPKNLAAKNETSLNRALEFLKDTSTSENITEMSLLEAETAKLLENSYRAANIAFIHEWTLLSEEAGVNLFSVINSIRKRKGTHDNIRAPGLGIGGPCLMKDTGFALMNSFDVDMPFLKLTLETSEKMNRHVCELVEKVSEVSSVIGLLGVTYRTGIEDTRNSPMNFIAANLKVAKKKVIAFDGLVTEWKEHSELELCSSFTTFLDYSDVIVLNQHAEKLLDQIHDYSIKTKKTFSLVDTSDVLSDQKARCFHEMGFRILGIGKGHWITMGLHL